MNFSVAVKDFAQALGRIASATPQRSPMPVLENVLLELEGSTLSLTATDMDITVTTTLEVRGTSNGSILVPAKRVTDTVRALELGELKFDVDPTNKRITLNTTSGEYKLSGLDASEFPQRAKFEPKVSLTLPLNKFTTMIDRTIFACSGDEFRPAMTGVLFQFRSNEIRAVATEHDVAIHIHGGFGRPPKPIDPKAAKLFALVEESAALLGRPITHEATGGVCDGNNIAACGVPVVDTMGARGGAIHSPDEYLIVESLAERAQLSTLVMLRLAEQGL